MSAEQLSSRISIHISSLSYQVSHQEVLKYLFEGFKTDLLLKADDKSNQGVTRIFARVVVETARRRKKKMKSAAAGKVLPSDFVPAFEYISDLCSRRLRLPKADVGVFTPSIVKLVKDSCPWC